jgi:hypothetical protein
MTLLTESIDRERQPLLFRAGEFNALQRKDCGTYAFPDRLDQVELESPLRRRSLSTGRAFR